MMNRDKDAKRKIAQKEDSGFLESLRELQEKNTTVMKVNTDKLEVFIWKSEDKLKQQIAQMEERMPNYVKKVTSTLKKEEKCERKYRKY